MLFVFCTDLTLPSIPPNPDSFAGNDVFQCRYVAKRCKATCLVSVLLVSPEVPPCAPEWRQPSLSHDFPFIWHSASIVEVASVQAL
jgi:hypothetical protein